MIALSTNKRMMLVQNNEGGYEIWTRSTPTTALWDKYKKANRMVAEETFDKYENATRKRETVSLSTPQKTARVSPVRKSKADGPVAKFKELFDANKDKSRKEIIELAVAAGISKGTASTYYYKMK